MFTHFYIAVSKILITSGSNTENTLLTSSEVLDLTAKGGHKCNNWPDFPEIGILATGGLIGSTGIVCSGWHISDYHNKSMITILNHLCFYKHPERFLQRFYLQVSATKGRKINQRYFFK